VHPQPTNRSKRLDHEGTVYEIKTGPRAGSWRAQLSVPGGKRRTFSGRSEDIVKQKLLDARFRLSHGQLSPPRGDNFEEYARDWLASRRHELRQRTLLVYRRNLEMHVFPHIGSHALLDVKARDIKAIHNALLDAGYKPKTVQLVRSIVSAVLAQAELDEIVPSNAASKVKLPRIKKPSFVPLDPTEIQTLIAAMRGDRLEALFLLTLTCGLRRGEACGVRWSDLDLERATLHLEGQAVRVQRADGRTGSDIVFEPLKSDTGETLVIDLAPQVIGALTLHKDRQAFTKLQAAELWKEQDYVFTDAIGQPLDPMQAYRMFKALLTRAGLRDQRFHDLRHAAASLLLSWGLELWQVSKLLRHSGLAITSDVYGHLYQQTGRELAERMGAFIQEAR
jgi:integrase